MTLPNSRVSKGGGGRVRAGGLFDWFGRKAERPSIDSELTSIPIAQISPGKYQPRRSIDQAELEGLAASIREMGVLQPVVVRPVEHGYELVMGERRWRAAKAAGLDQIPAIVRNLSDGDAALAALVENLQREDLSFWDEALAYDRLLKTFSMTQEQLAEALGKSQSTIANKVRLLRLPEEVKRQIQAAGLGERHARSLLRLPDKVAQMEAVRIMAEQQLSAAAAEQLVDQLLRNNEVSGSPAEDEPSESKSKRRGRRPGKRAKLTVIKDVRILLNTFKQGIEALRKAGLPAVMESQESDDHIEIHIRIPKE